MNAIKTLYRNAGLVTEDDYVKVNDNLWVASGPYQEQYWRDTDKLILPTKEELNEIYLKVQELICIQEDCGLKSLQNILDDNYPWVWSSTGKSGDDAWIQNISNSEQFKTTQSNDYWVIPIRRF